MNDPRAILTEEQTVALLHAGRSGSVPPLADPTATAIVHGRRMRRRRRVLHGTSGLALAALATVAIVTGAPDLDRASTVVGPAGPPGTEGVAPDSRSPEEINAAYLAEALGPSFTADGGRVTLRPKSAAAVGLPARYTAGGHASVSAVEPDAMTCIQSKPGAESIANCATRTLPDGGQVRVNTFAGYLSSDSIVIGKTDLFLVHPDGKQMTWVGLDVRGVEIAESKSRAPRDKVVAWFESFEDELLAAVSDPRMVGEAPTTPGPQTYGNQTDANLGYLNEALGDDFGTQRGRAGNAFLAPEPGSSAATRLPRGYVADALIAVTASSYAQARCGSSGGPGPAGPGGGGGCTGRGLEDGTQATILRERPAFYSPTRKDVLPGEPVDVRSAYFTRQDGSTAVATLVVRPSSATPIVRDTVPEAAITAWLDSFVDQLLAAAVDPRIKAPGGRAVETNDLRLLDALGSSWSLRDGFPQSSAPAPNGAELPEGVIGQASVRVSLGDADERRLCDGATSGATCSRETVDGHELMIGTTPPVRYQAGGRTFGAIHVTFSRANSEVVSIVITAADPNPPGGGDAARDTQIVRWLQTWAGALETAAVDPAMSQLPGYADPRR